MVYYKKYGEASLYETLKVNKEFCNDVSEYIKSQYIHTLSFIGEENKNLNTVGYTRLENLMEQDQHENKVIEVLAYYK